MALNNIRVEPKREITESLIGIGAVIGVVAGDYFLSVWLTRTDGWMAKEPVGLMMLTTPIFFILVTLILVGLTYFTHFLGEQVCAGLRKMGVDPRPKTRYVMTQVWNGGKYESMRRKVE